jgi:hypothetical protein
MRFAVIATGPSLTTEQVEKVRHLRTVAVSDAYRLAPWAEALVSVDKAWWLHHKPEFEGRRFSLLPVPGMETERLTGMTTDTNSGLRGIEIAVMLGATEVLLLGFDLGGTHFFGPHPEGLKNTPPQRFDVFNRQFAGYRPKGVKIINCTPGSALTCYPRADLDACLA